MITTYDEIVNVNYIGKQENPINMNEILKKAQAEQLIPANQDKERVLLLCIDEQQDFMDNGALGVPGANDDIARLTKWIYDNMEKISNIAVSIDTHQPHQIFHPCWWVDKDGNNPDPYTVITLADLDSGKWTPVINPRASRDYVTHLEQDAKKALCIWTYHCLQGTSGCALENQFSNMIYYQSVAKKAVIQRLVKGQDPMSEMYGIIKPEYNTKGYINLDFLNKVEKYDKIVIAGEAKSHCVQESISQILDHFGAGSDTVKKIYILEDCMSNIPGFEDASDAAYEDFKNKYHVNLVTTANFSL